MFVDYVGMSVAIYELKSHTVRGAQIIVAVPSASNFSYAEATWKKAAVNADYHIEVSRHY